MPADAPTRADVQAVVDAYLAELRRLADILTLAKRARSRRLEIWVELRRLQAEQRELPEDERIRISQDVYAEASGVDRAAISLALKRFDDRRKEVRG